MRDRLIGLLDGADLFLRNRANSAPAPLNEYDIEAMLDIAKTCDEAARALESAIIPPCKPGDVVYVVARFTGEIFECVVAGVWLYTNRCEIITDNGTVHRKSIGKTVFFTREEAEAALKGGV